jgi:hypothetical protein
MIQAVLMMNFSISGDGTSLTFKFAVNAVFLGATNGAGASGFPEKTLPNPNGVGSVTVVGSPTLTATASLSGADVTVTFSSAPGSGAVYDVTVPLLYNSL